MKKKQARNNGFSRCTLVALALALCAMFAASCHDGDDEQRYVDVSQFHPGDTVPVKALQELGSDAFFFVVPIPDTIFAIMQGKSYKDYCTVSRDSLRYIQCLHADRNGVTLVGEMVLNKSVAATVLAIFRQLYAAKYPIERMRLVDYWDADDERSMTDNNSSSFNFRFISHTQTVSKHGNGLAIDINTLYNPYHKFVTEGGETKEIIEPAAGAPYLDRTKNFDYKIEKGDLCYRLFTQAGFTWGGDWDDRKDYQHFEK